MILTPDQEAMLPVWREKWLKNSLSTKPLDEEDKKELRIAINKLYEYEGWEAPEEIIFVRSPMEAAFLAGYKAWLHDTGQNWKQIDSLPIDRKSFGADYADTPHSSLEVYKKLVPAECLPEVVKANNCYQGGNQWSSTVSYLTFYRDIVGVTDINWTPFEAWEKACIHGGYRILAEKFAIISDRPEFFSIDDQERPHNATGPYLRYRDGFSVYSFEGVDVPEKWVMEKGYLTPSIVLSTPNAELRRVGCVMLGWDKVLEDPSLNPKIIDQDEPHIGTLVEVDLPDAPKQWFLRYFCGTGRQFAEPVNDKTYDTALKANAGGNGWRGEGDPMSFIPFIRT